MNYNKFEKKIRSYVRKCIMDAFQAENRPYSDDAWNFEYVMVKNIEGNFQLYGFFDCKYSRVLRRVEFRLANNLWKNFRIYYGNTDIMRCRFLTDDVETSYTKAMFRMKSGDYKSISVFDERTNLIERGVVGHCMPSFIYETMLFHYWNIDAQIYSELIEKDKRYILPRFSGKNWNEFKELYKSSFGTDVGDGFEITCSKGIEML